MGGVIDEVAAMNGDEPKFFFSWSSGGDLGHAVAAEAACGLRWFSTAETVAERVYDLNRRAYVLLAISEAALAAGDTGRALSAARSVTALSGQVERVLRSKALALTVRCLLAHGDRDTARSTLVSGLTDCFAPDLIVAAQELDAPVASAVLDELSLWAAYIARKDTQRSWYGLTHRGRQPPGSVQPSLDRARTNRAIRPAWRCAQLPRNCHS